jgi:hypothetical protein
MWQQLLALLATDIASKAEFSQFLRDPCANNHRLITPMKIIQQHSF